jgi:hypothetical protein
MVGSSFERSVEQWLGELNNAEAEHRRAALTALANSGTLDDRLINELKLIARGDPDLQTKSLARKLLNSRGIKILPQISDQPGVKPKSILSSWGFWIGFFGLPIFNFILFAIPQFLAFISNRTIGLVPVVVVDIFLFIYFWLTRRNVALGMLAGFVLSVVSLICAVFSLLWRCWPDGCPH